MTKNDHSIASLLASAFPGQSIGEFAPTVGGYSHTTQRVTIGVTRCVLKLATDPLKRADVRHEARMLAAIAPLGLPAPAALACIEAQQATLLVTRELQGDNGLALLGHAQNELAATYHALGALAARIHAAPLAPPDQSLLLARRIEQTAHALAALPIDAALRVALLHSLAHPAWHEPPRLLHGDLGLHNILWNGQAVALLDWEWSCWGTPLLDLAWLAWTLRWRNLPDALWHAFLSGYEDLSGLQDLTGLNTLALGQIAMILARVRGNDAAFAEWERRARWSLAEAR